jgi:hypothetical protein
MRNRFLSSFIVLVTAFTFAPGVFAQNNQFDITGVWRILAPGRTAAVAQSVGAGAAAPTLGANRPAMTAWGQEKWSQTRPSGRQGPLSFVFLPDQKDWNDPIFVCDPAGYPRTGAGNTLMRFVQLQGQIVQFFERDHFWRDFWMDGRTLPGLGAKPRWYGYSVARWEGDTLVVESSGFDDRTWLNQQGSIHSVEMRLVERFKVINPNRIESQMTLTDPKAYTAPWVGPMQIMERMPTSDGVADGIWGKKPDGTPYPDIREDLCVYADERGFWINDDPAGLGDNFGDAVIGADKK